MAWLKVHHFSPSAACSSSIRSTSRKDRTGGTRSRARDHYPGGNRNIEGRYGVAFRVDCDTVTFHLLWRGPSDAFLAAAWETWRDLSPEERERTLFPPVSAVRCPGSDQAVVTTSWGAVPAAPSFVA